MCCKRWVVKCCSVSSPWCWSTPDSKYFSDAGQAMTWSNKVLLGQGLFLTVQQLWINSGELTKPIIGWFNSNVCFDVYSVKFFIRPVAILAGVQCMTVDWLLFWAWQMLWYSHKKQLGVYILTMLLSKKRKATQGSKMNNSLWDLRWENKHSSKHKGSFFVLHSKVKNNELSIATSLRHGKKWYLAFMHVEQCYLLIARRWWKF